MARITAQLLLGIGLSVALACGDSDPARHPGGPPAGEVATGALPRGLWVLCEGSQRVLEHPERIRGLVEDAGGLGASDLFVQVYRGGRAWFDSSHADAAPYRALREATGTDTLAELIAQAHEAGLRVHAWVNVLSLAHNRDAPLVKDLGRDAVIVDRFGRSVLEFPNFEVPPPDRRYYRMGTPALWLDPAVPSVAARLSVTFAELLTRYPELDGLHFDYIRYPDVLPFAPGSRFGVGLDFGYGPLTRARFKAETGLDAPFGDSLANANRWDSWRRDQLTGRLVALRMAARTAHPEVQLSAAVIPHVDRAYLALGQDWRRWLEDGLLEFAVPMAYTLDDRILRYQVESLAHLPVGGRIWIGLGTWLFAKHPQRALEQIRLTRAAGATGESLFSYDSIAEAPALREALVRAASAGG
jgi:uncharacterized lipoprotein YddW (UPF0748 family)